MTTTSMEREKFHELEPVFIGESLASTAHNGELRSYFNRGYREVQTRMPVTFTFPLDYPVFVG